MKNLGDPKTNGPFLVGVDAGSVSINCIVIDAFKHIVFESPYKRHMGRVEQEVESILATLYGELGQDNIGAVAFTGSHGQTISNETGGFFEFETISHVLGACHLEPKTRAVISMGGQDTALFQIGHHGDRWELEYFHTNGPCASGTGSFIDQQAQRLATSMYRKDTSFSQDQIDGILKDFIALGQNSERPANVACRCTVFTKSDMIHLQNKGERLEDIIFGLHMGNARNYVSTIVSNRILEKPILFVGGLSLNALQVRALRHYFPELIVPAHSTSIGALGVALQALELGIRNRVDVRAVRNVNDRALTNVPVAEKLELRMTDFPEDNDIGGKKLGKRVPVYLGIDIGSTTTKYALIDDDGMIIGKDYVHTRGKPVEVTQGLLANIRSDASERLDIRGMATTGSGRNVVGDFLNADLIIDEITAHARGAVQIDETVDTIFEIGGQDSKYIFISRTHPQDFDMNKVCAAGTGSFLHELANKFGVNIVDEFQQIALSSQRPVKLAERCTVFMESDLVSYHQKGIARNDLLAGLCYAIAYNYMNRVVGKRKIGQRVMFLGGPSLNKGVVAAFENILGRKLIIPKHREVLGAFGAALSVREKILREKRPQSVFRGIDRAIADRMDFQEKVCHADSNCHNRCKLKIYDFDGRKSIWGGECGRYESTGHSQSRKENYFQMREMLWRTHLSGKAVELGDEPILQVDGRPTVGMQRSLYGNQTVVLWAHFFDHLGFRLVLTPPTNSQIVRDGIETVTAETCFPVKVSHGHVKYLLGKTRFLFLPVLIDMQTPEKNETGFYCPLVQSNYYMARTALNLNNESVLHPILHMKYDAKRLAVVLSEHFSSKLAISRKRIAEALDYGLSRQQWFIRDMHEQGRKILGHLDAQKPSVVVTGRPYNLYDERLNLRLGHQLAKIGVSAIPMDFIDVSAVDLSDFSSMYWGSGAQILRTAKYIKSRANFFGLHVTNFSCGADSFVEHFYKYVMGDKPYLILELDEHSAVAGVMTRIEAYRNVIHNVMDQSRSEACNGLRLAN